MIIPVYNREKYIKKCLEIIINQTYKNLEVIVVDDGSTDNSVNLIKQFKEVKLISCGKQGPSVARNLGVNNATGKYIHFMDDDDEINTEFYENLVGASEKFDADISCCSFIYGKEPNRSVIFKKQKIYKTTQEKYRGCYTGKYGFAWRYLFKRDFLNKYHLSFEEGRIIEDLPFSFKAVFYANKVVTVPDSIYTYVFNPDSCLNVIDEEMQEKRNRDYEHAKQNILNFAKENGDFKIPGVNTGKIGYFYYRVKLGIELAIKHRDTRHLRF